MKEKRKKFNFSYHLDDRKYILFRFLQGLLGLRYNYEVIDFLLDYYIKRENIDLDKILGYNDSPLNN